MIVHRVEHNRRRLRLLVHVCESRLERARGLLLRRRLDHQTAFLLAPCAAVHTVGMTYPIDVLFCAADGLILAVVEGLGPCRFARQAACSAVWEFRAGAVRALDLRPGDRINPC
jgi:uncharacterized membrane protein (UPF0127 family)